MAPRGPLTTPHAVLTSSYGGPTSYGGSTPYCGPTSSYGTSVSSAISAADLTSSYSSTSSYGAPTSSYGAPTSSYGAPASSYGAATSAPPSYADLTSSCGASLASASLSQLVGFASLAHVAPHHSRITIWAF